ncbi:MAG: hypothetical protein PHW03_09830 [Eubacteriales bacterium]|nr:hypothetical protein [Eubacteriales bacterium]
MSNYNWVLVDFTEDMIVGRYCTEKAALVAFDRRHENYPGNDIVLAKIGGKRNGI